MRTYSVCGPAANARVRNPRRPARHALPENGQIDRRTPASPAQAATRRVATDTPAQDGGCFAKPRAYVSAGVRGASGVVDGRGGLGSGVVADPERAFAGPFHAAAVAIWWLWSFSILWAVISRHSERAAALARRWKRSMRRLNFVCPNTGTSADPPSARLYTRPSADGRANHRQPLTKPCGKGSPASSRFPHLTQGQLALPPRTTSERLPRAPARARSGRGASETYARARRLLRAESESAPTASVTARRRPLKVWPMEGM